MWKELGKSCYDEIQSDTDAIQAVRTTIVEWDGSREELSNCSDFNFNEANIHDVTSTSITDFNNASQTANKVALVALGLVGLGTAGKFLYDKFHKKKETKDNVEILEGEVVDIQ